jgi:hypothetical protein
MVNAPVCVRTNRQIPLRRRLFIRIRALVVKMDWTVALPLRPLQLYTPKSPHMSLSHIIF